MAGVRFFQQSFADINRSSVTVSLSNNDSHQDALFNRDPLWVWRSTGSNDGDAIELVVNFGIVRQVDTLMLIKTNLKAFTLYRRGAVGEWVPVLEVTDNAAATYFSQFSPVSTDAVRLVMQSTQVPDAEKTIRDFIITREIGQLSGYPKISTAFDQNATAKEMLSGKEKITYRGITHEVNLDFKDYVSQADRALFAQLIQMREPVLVWPCGGQPEQFAFNDVGYRLEDIYLMGSKSKVPHDFTHNLYGSGMNSSLRLVEVA